MQEHSIRINLFNIGVRYDVTVSPRQEEKSSGLHWVPDIENHSGTECGCESQPWECDIYDWVEFGDKDSLVTREPIKLLCQIQYVSEKKCKL